MDRYEIYSLNLIFYIYELVTEAQTNLTVVLYRILGPYHTFPSLLFLDTCVIFRVSVTKKVAMNILPCLLVRFYSKGS